MDVADDVLREDLLEERLERGVLREVFFREKGNESLEGWEIDTVKEVEFGCCCFGDYILDDLSEFDAQLSLVTGVQQSGDVVAVCFVDDGCRREETGAKSSWDSCGAVLLCQTITQG